MAMMSWFHLTVEGDSPVVIDLRAQATSAEQRLFKIAQLVGVPAHGLSGSYFDIADDISRLLLLIETGVFTAIPHAVAALVHAGVGARARHAHDHHALVDHHRPRHEGRKGCAARDRAPLGLGSRRRRRPESATGSQVWQRPVSERLFSMRRASSAKRWRPAAPVRAANGALVAVPFRLRSRSRERAGRRTAARGVCRRSSAISTMRSSTNRCSSC